MTVSQRLCLLHYWCLMSQLLHTSRFSTLPWSLQQYRIIVNRHTWPTNARCLSIVTLGVLHCTVCPNCHVGFRAASHASQRWMIGSSIHKARQGRLTASRQSRVLVRLVFCAV